MESRLPRPLSLSWRTVALAFTVAVYVLVNLHFIHEGLAWGPEHGDWPQWVALRTHLGDDLYTGAPGLP